MDLLDPAKLIPEATRSHWASRRSATIVGAGIVNLVTAYALAKEGYALRIVEAAPDPAARSDWRGLGCTFGGADARIFSLNESRNHLLKYAAPGEACPFSRVVDDGGWLLAPVAEGDHRTRRWIEMVRSVGPADAARINEDVISFNQESASRWRAMMRSDPRLFEGVGYREGLLRLYSTRAQFEAALPRETAIGAHLASLNPEALWRKYPSLRPAIAQGSVAAGMEVVGFSVNIHRFGLRLIEWLRERGATLDWNRAVAAISRDGRGRVMALVDGDGDCIRDSNYVISSGAGTSLLEGTRSADAIAPVVGLWLTLPDDAGGGLDVPLKITRSGPSSDGAAEGANAIGGVGEDGRRVIHVSSGHGLMSMDARRNDPATFRALSDVVDHTARTFFPDQYARAAAEGLLGGVRRYCVRPWTWSGLGLFEECPSDAGGSAIITGGHNTGGFAQSPAVAAAVAASLRGEAHPMQRLYDPRRAARLRVGAAAAPMAALP